MDIKEIDKKVKFNPVRIHRLIAREAGRHINGLIEPCYEVDTKKFQYILYRELGVPEKDWQAAANASEDLVGAAGKGKTYRVPFTFLLAYLSYRYIRANKLKMANDVLLYHLVKNYGSVREKFFPKFCDPDTFRYTIINLTKTHLFYREKNVAGALIFLMNAIGKKFFPLIKNTKEWDPVLMHKYMHDNRDRLNQSMRTFTQTYMRNIDAGKKISAEREAETEDERNLLQTTTAASGQAAIEKFLKNMYVYRGSDNKAVVDAKRESKVKNNLAEMILTMIHNRSSEENVKTILTNFMKEVQNQRKDSKFLCGTGMYSLVRSLMMKRGYEGTFIFKALVVNFTESMIDRLDPMIKKSMARDMKKLETFVALYLTLRFRNLFC